jgi:hypothetical protein
MEIVLTSCFTCKGIFRGRNPQTVICSVCKNILHRSCLPPLVKKLNCSHQCVICFVPPPVPPKKKAARKKFDQQAFLQKEYFSKAPVFIKRRSLKSHITRYIKGRYVNRKCSHCFSANSNVPKQDFQVLYIIVHIE